MTWQAIPYIVLLGFFWGSTLIASRFSVGQYEATTYIGLRLLIAAVAHILVYTLMKRPFPRNKNLWKRGVFFGVFATALPMTCIVMGLQYLSSGVASILITLNPAMTVLLAHFFLPDEPLTKRKAGGVALALSGALLLALRGETGLDDISGSQLGYTLLLISVCIGSFGVIYARKYLKEFDSFDVASVRMFAAGVTVLPLSIFFVGFDMSAVEAVGYGALFYAALVGTFSGMMLSFYNIKHFGALAAATTSYVIPIVATIGGFLILNEQITPTMGVGMAIIIGGISLLRERSNAVDSGENAKAVPLPQAGD